MKIWSESSSDAFAVGTALRRTLAVSLLAVSLTACGAAQEMAGMSYENLPESPEVENAPWPRLADSPTPVAPVNSKNPEDDLPERRRAAAVNADMNARASQLRAEAERLRTEKSSGGRVVALTNQRASEALAAEEATVKAADADDAELLRKQIEEELNAAFGDDAAAAD